MRLRSRETIPNNTAWAGDLQRGEVLRVIATTIVDFVAFDRADLRRRFDQARTKVYNMTIFVSAGHTLMSKDNQPLLTIVEDTYDRGTHDLQEGMCSGYRFQLAKREGKVAFYYGRPDVELPDHGCHDNLEGVLAPHGIAREDIPSPLNLFQTMEIDGRTGRMAHTTIRPDPGTHVDLRAERDLLVAFSACPDMVVGGKPVSFEVYAPD